MALIKAAAVGANQHDYREEPVRITAAKDAGNWAHGCLCGCVPIKVKKRTRWIK